MKVELKWIDNMRFIAVPPSGHGVYLETKAEVGGMNSGPSPMELLLIALGGCTSMDVVSILRKMKEDIEDYRLEIEAERAQKHPRYYTKIHLKYLFYGKHLKEENIKRAVELSQTKYCSVSENLKGRSEISYSYEIIKE